MLAAIPSLLRSVSLGEIISPIEKIPRHSFLTSAPTHSWAISPSHLLLLNKEQTILSMKQGKKNPNHFLNHSCSFRLPPCTQRSSLCFESGGMSGLWNQAQTFLRIHRSQRHVLRINTKVGKQRRWKTEPALLEAGRRKVRGALHGSFTQDAASCWQYPENIAQRLKERALSLEQGRN